MSGCAPAVCSSRRSTAALLLLLALMPAGCLSRPALVAALPKTAGCPAISGAADAILPIQWLAPVAEGERLTLGRWCEAVGPPVVRAGVEQAGQAPVDEIAVLSWNVHVGGGDLAAAVNGLRSGALSGGRPMTEFVLLLQEAYRAGETVPRALQLSTGFAGAIQPSTGLRKRQDIVVAAEQLGLWVYYAPSMRNGHPRLTDEDRGNAILSTRPLSALSAIELPFERQRRVAISAQVGGRMSDGTRWTLRVTSAHLDNLAGPAHAWVITGPARARQARGLLSGLPSDGPAVLAGDLNTWFGFSDPAYREIARRFAESPALDRRATFARLLRLDHVFFQVPDGWQTSVARVDNRFGSDHHPLLARIRFGGAPTGAIAAE